MEMAGGCMSKYWLNVVRYMRLTTFHGYDTQKRINLWSQRAGEVKEITPCPPQVQVS